MPTISCQPSLKSTQAVGAVLLHQFARQRFIEAGLDEQLIREAENIEDLDQLTSELLDDSSATDDINCSNNSSSINDTTSATINTSADNQNTTLNDNSSSGIAADLFQSMAETTTMTNNQDQTMYHSMNTSNNVASTLDKLQTSSIMASYGRELRRIADEFEKTRERQIIKERANQVNLDDINKESFFELMDELFQGGITGERIVMLFLFSTDVALRAASFAHKLVVKLLGWSFSFIINTVCKVVHELGGWDNLLCRQLPYLLMLCFLALGTCAFAVYLKRALRA